MQTRKLHDIPRKEFQLQTTPKELRNHKSTEQDVSPSCCLIAFGEVLIVPILEFQDTH